MGTLTRRDRVALGSAQGGALYYGPNRRWPEHAPGIFEPFGTPHPGATQRPPTDIYAHYIRGFAVSDLDGTPKLYTGYGGATVNQTPIHIWPLKFDGTWDAAPAHTMPTFGMTAYHQAEGKLWCYGEQGPTAFCTGSPGGTWVDGECFPHTGTDGGMTHPNHIARHGGYTWIAGQKRVVGDSGAVWRCTTPTGSDGEFVFGDPLGLKMYQPNNLFAYQGKLWLSPSITFAETVPPYQQGRLCYWDEPAHTFLPINVSFQYASVVAPWKTVMLVGDGPKLMSFNGTSATTVYTSPGVGAAAASVQGICVTPDDTVWFVDSKGDYYSSTDLVTWRFRMRSSIDSTLSFTVYQDYVYTGDKHDRVWRTKVET